MKRKQVFIFLVIGFLLIFLTNSEAIDISPPQGALSITINLLPGWNLISCPGVPVVADIPTLIAGNPMILAYAKVYNPATTSYENRTTIEYGKAYWFGAGAATQFTMNYSPMTSLVAALSPGWNMVGSMSESIAFADIVITPPGSTLPYAKSYNTATQSYVNQTIIEPGKGYWFGAGAICSVEMTGLPLPPGAPPVFTAARPTWESVLSIQTQGKQKELVFGMHGSASDGFDISFDDPTPPLPDSQSSLKAGWSAKSSAFPILGKSIVYEGKKSELELSMELSEAGEISWRNLPDSYQSILVYGSRSVDMHKEQSLSLPSGKYNMKILLSKRELPKHTVLLANYPNPFNPETWIPFELSKDTKVEIMIYSSAGQLVRRLDLGRKPAGSYAPKSKAAYWDGKNEAGETVSSGLYFYTLVTPEVTQTRKFVIVR